MNLICNPLVKFKLEVWADSPVCASADEKQSKNVYQMTSVEAKAQDTGGRWKGNGWFNIVSSTCIQICRVKGV